MKLSSICIGSALLAASLTAPAAEAADTWIYYNSTYMAASDITPLRAALTGVGASVTTSTSASWPTSWTGYKLVIILLPASSFSTTQASALKSFVNGGGRLVLAGDWDLSGLGFRTNNNHINSLTTSMGVSLSISNTLVTGTEAGCSSTSTIATDQITGGVGNAKVAATSAVSGGTTLVSYGSSPVLAVAQPSSATSARSPYDVIVSGDVNLFLSGCTGSTSAGSNYTIWENLYDICSDADGDSYIDASCGGTDCDDGDITVHPGASETAYDGVDQDCSGSDLIDVDGDGYAWDGVGGTDCWDTESSVHPGATETADGVDEDCDSSVDEATSWADDDGDGYTEAGGDCDDADATVSPAATETADITDEDCDGIIDEGTELYDDDGDGRSEVYGDCNDGDPTVRSGYTEIAGNGVDDDCDGVVDAGAWDPDGDGFTADGGDCDETDGSAYPGGTEVADGVDNDCDGLVDEGTADWDGDGDGATPNGGDCNDADAGVSPAAEEQPDNGVDDDCDGLVDEGSERVDDDGDGYSEETGDCDDANGEAAPSQEELPGNGVDDNCDGTVDESTEDADADGYSGDEDCDEGDPWSHKDAREFCDSVDNNCDGQIDEGCADTSIEGETGKTGSGCANVNPAAGALGGLALSGAALLLGRRRRPSRG